MAYCMSRRTRASSSSSSSPPAAEPAVESESAPAGLDANLLLRLVRSAVTSAVQGEVAGITTKFDDLALRLDAHHGVVNAPRPRAYGPRASTDTRGGSPSAAGQAGGR